MLEKKRYQKKSIDINAIHYYNANGEKVCVFSDYQLILSEIRLLGFEPSDISIKELKSSISKLMLDNYMEMNFEGKDACKLEKEKKIKYAVLYFHIKELLYWLYDFDPKKMPSDLQVDFKYRD
jgi:hypothetical protein